MKTYRGQKAFCEALGITYVEIETLSDQECHRRSQMAILECDELPLPGPKHDDETKLAISESNKEYYKTPRGIRRRESLAERNRQTKSEELKTRWQNNYDEMKERTKAAGRPKGSKDLRKRKPRTERPVLYGTVLYESAEVAAQHHYPNNINGPHYIRRLCRLQRMEWKYYDQDSCDN